MPNARSVGEIPWRGGEPRRATRRVNLGSILSVGASVIAVAGSVAYLLLRFSYAEFYDHFGVAPEEVGLSRGEVLAQAALGLLLYLAWATLGAVLLVVIL